MEDGLDDIENNLRSLAAEQESARDEQNKRQRRYQYAPMTQFSTAPDATQTDSQGGPLEDTPSGYIKKVSLRNFMCHENFELALGPRLNFIVGNNGSGKSAILTAITIGLGAKASDTNRGTSLKSLIKEGCHQARITLTLENGKHGAYSQGTFGSEIVIQRVIKADGAASFSLRSESGTEISNKKKDIQAVVDYFAVPINNPMCFLSQDAARSFLTASTPQDKYVHFMKGTLLQDITDSLDQAREISKQAQENMVLHQRNLNDLKDEFEEARRLFKELSKTTDLQERKKLLQGKSLWIDVIDNTKARDKLKSEAEAQEEAIRLMKEKIKAKKDKIDRFNVDVNVLRSEIDANVALVLERDTEHQRAEDALNKIKGEYETERRKKQSVESESKDCEEKVKRLDRTINHIKESLRVEMGGDREVMKRDLMALEAENNNLKKSLEFSTKRQQDLRNNETELVRQRQNEVDAKRRSIKYNENEIEQMSRGKSDLLSNFDSRMPYLIDALRNRSREFQTPPIGPLGLYITVKSGFERWTRAIQTQLSQYLNTFVVSNQQDCNRLREIVRSCGVKSNLPIMTVTASKVTHERVQCQHPSIADALEFSASEVEFVLLDTSRVLKVLLIQDRDVARDFLLQKPPGFNTALSIRNDTSGYQITGGRRIDTVSYQTRLRLREGGAANSDTTYLKNIIAKENSELREINDDFEKKLREVRSELNMTEIEIRKIRSKLAENDSQAERLKRKLNTVVDTGSLESTEIEKKRALDMIATYESAAEEIIAKIKKVEQTIEPLKKRFDETKIALAQAREKLRQSKDDVSNRSAKIQKWGDDITDMERKIETCDASARFKRRNIEQLAHGIEVQIANAQEFCSREQASDPHLPEDQDEIKREVERVSNMILRAERNVGVSKESASELLETSRAKYEAGYGTYKEIDGALKILTHSIDVRVQNLQAAQKSTCLDADLDFRSSLKVRGFSGNLAFSIPSKQLMIYTLTPNDNRPRNVDTLSGGEKSFSQMALLLATWKPMRSRIIALDEFDVFMDQVNRKMGTRLILEKLKNNSRTQTIIITPQDIGRIADLDSSGVEIHKMRDPRRQNNSTYYAHG